MMKKRIAALAGGGVFALLVAGLLSWNTPSAAKATPSAAKAGVVTVYKNPSCGCCAAWVDHMRAAGFELEVHDLTDLQAIKAEHGISANLGSCHTALVDGYVVEGHVPADLVYKMLDERPDIAGLAVPGMVVGTPGMEVPGQPAQPYDVIAFDATGRTAVYAKR